MGTIFEFLFLNLAWMVALSVPCAVLMATIMAFGRLSAENEITAVKAGGISLYQYLPQLFLVSAALAVFLIWFNNSVLPDSNHRARLLMVDIARKKPMINLEPGVVYTDIPNYSILVQNVNENNSVSHVKNITIDDQSASNTIRTIRANTGEIYFSKTTGQLVITLFDGELQEVDLNNPETFKKIEFPKHIIKVPMSEMLLVRTQSEYRGDREKSAAALLEGVRRNRSKILQRKQKLNKNVSDQLFKYMYANAGGNMPLRTIIQDHKRLIRQIKTELNLMNSYNKSNNMSLVEVHKKYSIPTICMVFILIGAPLGIMARKRGWAVAAGLSIGFFMLYWAFLIGGEALADRQKITPFWAMWSPNILVGGLGIYLVLRNIRETTIINWSVIFGFLPKRKNTLNEIK